MKESITAGGETASSLIQNIGRTIYESLKQTKNSDRMWVGRK